MLIVRINTTSYIARNGPIYLTLCSRGNTDFMHVECAKRWLHFINPELNHSEWTKQEDTLLLTEVQRHGRNWRKIVDEVLEGRSATDAKNR